MRKSSMAIAVALASIGTAFGKDIPLYTVPQIMLSPVGQEPLEWN